MKRKQNKQEKAMNTIKKQACFVFDNKKQKGHFKQDPLFKQQKTPKMIYLIIFLFFYV